MNENTKITARVSCVQKNLFTLLPCQNNKVKEPVTEMLKDNLPLSKILKYSRLDKESIYEIAKDSNLSVIDDTVSTSGYSKAFQELIDKEFGLE